MDTVLHIEPITRQTPAPLRIGHTDYVYYGTRFVDEYSGDENLYRDVQIDSERMLDDTELGDISSGSIRLGCPLESLDLGSTMNHIPLVKTFECHPDESLPKGNIYTETLHYVKDRKNLIPFRTKIHNGLGEGLRMNHLPGLNAIRKEITGFDHEVCDPRSDVLTELFMSDKEFRIKPNPHLQEWIVENLVDRLSRLPINVLSFDTSDTSDMVRRYLNQVHRTPHDFTHQNLKDIVDAVTPESSVISPLHHFHTADNLPLVKYRQQLTPHGVDLRSYGRIALEGLSRIDYNPFYFQPVCELIDNIPLTDFNVDLVLTCDNDIQFYHEHIAVNRIGWFADNESGMYSASTILKDALTPYELNKILDLTVRYHSCMTDEIEGIIYREPIKIKVIKTITDEAAVLIYRYDSGPQDQALCGIYFDIALQSLSPLSIIPQPILN